jgi:putative hydrolase of the HAD superfamily
MKVVIFDLDDTLYKEIDYLKSAYREIATYLISEFEIEDPFDLMIKFYSEGKNVFNELNIHYNLPVPIEHYLKIYRNHFPTISLDEITCNTLVHLKNQGYAIGLITDGRTITQKNKIKALGLSKYLDKKLIVISEDFGFSKPSIEIFLYFQDIFSNAEFFYIGDNIQKDFITPNSLDWKTICLLDNGLNIHRQDFNLPKDFQPKYIVTTVIEIIYLL